MIEQTNMSNPISSIRPAFGDLTLRRGSGETIHLKGFSHIKVDNVDRGDTNAYSSEDLSMKNFV